MMYCGVCKMRLNFFSPDLFVCPTGHYAIKVTMSQGERTAYTSRFVPDAPLAWPGPYKDGARTPVHPWYYEAFKDAEVWEI